VDCTKCDLPQANGKMRACGDAGVQFRVSRVRDRVGSDGVTVSTFYFLSHKQPAEAHILAGPHFTHSPFRMLIIYFTSALSIPVYLIYAVMLRQRRDCRRHRVSARRVISVQVTC